MISVERNSLLSQEVSSPATPPSPIATSNHDDNLVKRQRVIQELYETERDYHSELTVLIEKVLPSFKKVRASVIINSSKVTFIVVDIFIVEVCQIWNNIL